MAIWQVFVFLGVLLLMVLMFANIVLPPFINKPFFFMFRKSERKLLDADQDFANTMTNLQAVQTRKGVELLSDQTTLSKDFKEGRREDRLTDNMKTEL